MNLRYLILAFAILLPGTGVSSQTTGHSEVNPYNVSDELRACLRTKPELEIDGRVNPFYISGDFDGDGFTDSAVQVKTRKDQRQGMLICFAKGNPVLFGAGAAVVWPQEDDGKWPFDFWMLIRKGSKHLSIYPQIKFDTLALIKGDEGGGLVYWDGQRFRWQQQE